jgi:hypothetical protein
MLSAYIRLAWLHSGFVCQLIFNMFILSLHKKGATQTLTTDLVFGISGDMTVTVLLLL